MGVAKRRIHITGTVWSAEAFWFLPGWLSCNDSTLSTLLWINSVPFGPFGFNFRSNAITQGNHRKPIHQLSQYHPRFHLETGCENHPDHWSLESHCPSELWTPEMAEVDHWWHPLHLHRLCGSLTTLWGQASLYVLSCFVCNGLNGHVRHHFPGFGLFYSFMFWSILVMYFYDIFIMFPSDENFIITSFWHTMVCLSNEDVVLMCALCACYSEGWLSIKVCITPCLSYVTSGRCTLLPCTLQEWTSRRSLFDVKNFHTLLRRIVNGLV